MKNFFLELRRYVPNIFYLPIYVPVLSKMKFSSGWACDLNATDTCTKSEDKIYAWSWIFQDWYDRPNLQFNTEKNLEMQIFLRCFSSYNVSDVHRTYVGTVHA